METYRTAPQVARMFRVNTPTVRRYIRGGELPAARVGHRYVIAGKDIDEFVVARKEARSAEGTEHGRRRWRSRARRGGR